MQLQLEMSKIELRLKEIDELKTKQEVKEYLEILDLSELLEIYYIQSCEINRIRKVILNSVRDND